MQQARTQDQVEYAALGWRFAAVLVDTLVLFGLLIIAAMVYIVVLSTQGKLDLNDPAAVQALSSDLRISDVVANVVVFGGLFVYYVVLETIFGASIGKLVFRMRVTMLDGTRPTGLAVLVRNAVRLPEAWMLYVPSAISCLASGRRQRLGDHAARTVVVRRREAPQRTVPGADVPAAFWPASPGGAGPAAGSTPATAGPQKAPSPPAPSPASSAAADPSLPQALAALKNAALAVHGAHLSYLRFAEIELASAGDSGTSGEYSAGYVSAWYTLTDAAAEFRRALAAAGAGATAEGATLTEAAAGQPDLLHLLQELGPYASATSDEAVHEAFLTVARRGTTGA